MINFRNIKKIIMFDIKIFIRLTRIDVYFPQLLLIFPLIFIISPQKFLSLKTAIIFLAIFFLTTYAHAINDVEDSDDDYHVLKKRKRNPISNKDLTKKQGYVICISLLLTGLFLLLTVSFIVFSLGLTLGLLGFFYSWKPVRLKSIPVADIISHAIGLGVLQFSITYLAFRSFDLFFIPFLIIIVPLSLITEIFHELGDFNVDKKTKIKNTVQILGIFNTKKLTIILGIICTVGFLLLFYNIYPNVSIIFLSPLIFFGNMMYIKHLFKSLT